MHARSLAVDLFKVVAAQLIVWHHLSAYGPMAELMREAWPALMSWLYEHARQAVQVFLVVGGYLAAQSLPLEPRSASLGRSLRKRFLRLVPIYVLSLALIGVVVMLAREAIAADWLPSSPTLAQWLAHSVLLHDVLGFEALSSGVWYVAIDFQLYALLLVLSRLDLMWLKLKGTALSLSESASVSAQRVMQQRGLSIVVALLCAASMWHFNRDASWDRWALYFFGAYGLGVLAAWAKRSRWDALLFAAVALLALGALWLEYRSRLNLALLTAVFLATQTGTPSAGPEMHASVQSLIQRLSNSAYVLFLTHFAVIVAFSFVWNTHIAEQALAQPLTALGLTILAWLFSVALGWVLHEKLEVPLQRWTTRKAQN